MILRWSFLTLLAFSGLAPAAMTAGWKLPEEAFRSTYLGSGNARKLDKPPGSSVFLQPGDELWDIAPVLPSRATIPTADPFAPSPGDGTWEDIPAPAWGGEWLVWDARSQMLVARGTRNELLAVERLLGLNDRPLQTRTRLEIVTRHPASSRVVSLISRSGEKAGIEVGGWKSELTAVISPSSRAIDLELAATWPGPQGEDIWELKTAVVLPDGERTLVARQGDGEIWASATLESMDGTLLSKMRWIEKGDAVEAVPSIDKDPEAFVESLDSDRSIAWFAGASRRIGPEELRALLAAPLIDAPPELHSRVHGRFSDLLPYLTRETSSAPAPGSFAGYDPLADAVVIVSSPAAIALIKDHLIDQSGPCSPTNVSIETNPAAGGWFILGRSGEQESLTLKKGEALVRGFTISPTISAATGVLDLSYELKFLAPGNPETLLKSTAVLLRDQATKVCELNPPAGAPLPVEITARCRIVDQ